MIRIKTMDQIENKIKLIGPKRIMILIIITISVLYIKAYMDKNEAEVAKKEMEQKLIKRELAIEKLEDAYQAQKKKYSYLERIIKDLDRCRYPLETLGIGYSETNINFNAKHPTPDLFGVGGLKKHWLKELNKKGIPINSLRAIDEVYSIYIKNSKTKDIALKGYKGTINNKKSFYRTKALIKKIERNNNLYEMLKHHRRNKSLLEEVSELRK